MPSKDASSPRSDTPAGRVASAEYTVLDASPNAVLAVDAGGAITYLNPQVSATFGYERAKLLGKPVEVLLPDRVKGHHVAHRDGFLAHPVARPMGIGLDLAGRRRDGTEFPVEISLSPVETDAGLQVFATVVDITARKAAEVAVLQAQKLESIGRLAGGIAHDFNNMLFAISGYAELLEEDLRRERPEDVDIEDAIRSVALISEAAGRAARLTSQLLTFSRQQVIRPIVLELNAAVEGLEPMIRSLIGSDMTLVLGLDPAAGRISLDAGQLDQIVVNLVANARDAMPGGGTIEINTANVEIDEAYALEYFEVLPGSYVLLSMSDTGVGMDRATREHIFEPFFTTKELGKGTGLGLATIYGIVRQVGGHIWLYSEPGVGSTFKLYFPRVDAPPAPPLPVVPQRSVRAGTGTVLLAEDDQAVRDLTSRILTRYGYSVTAVGDGASALRVAEALDGQFAALVTDVIMPNLSGTQLASEILDRYPDVGVVLMSGYTAERLNLERLIARGALFVTKPVTTEELVIAVNRATGARLEAGPDRS